MSKHNNEYIYDGKSFSSINALSKYTGVNEKTITARLKRNMSIDDACSTKRVNGCYFMDNGIEKPLIQICAEQNKNISLVRNRMKLNYNLNKALNEPKKVTKQGSQIVVHGILYNSIAEAIRKLNLSHKETTIRRRLRAGISPDDAFKFDEDL